MFHVKVGIVEKLLWSIPTITSYNKDPPVAIPFIGIVSVWSEFIATAVLKVITPKTVFEGVFGTPVLLKVILWLLTVNLSFLS